MSEAKPTTIRSGRANVSVGLLREIYDFREMFWVLVWRDIRTRYAQSVLGLGWAIFPAISQALIYTLIFGRLVRLDSDGAPYSMFALVGVIPWIFFSQAFNAACSSVYGNGSFIQKIYFPRVFLPAAAILDKGFDFLVALCVTFIVLCFFGGDPNWNVVFLPLLILLILVTTLGYGMLVAAICVHFRDLLHMMGYVTMVLMYCSPVVYPVSLVPQKWVYIYALNPMVGIIEGFRCSLLSTKPMPWDLILISAIVSFSGLIIGFIYFRATEPKFADVA